MSSEVESRVTVAVTLIDTPVTNMSGNLTHVLFENASGYALFEVTMQEEIVSLWNFISFCGFRVGLADTLGRV